MDGRPRSARRLVHLVVEHLEAAVGHEDLRHADALRGLVVLDDGGHDARQGEGRAVERVAELDLLGVGMAEAAVEAVGLVAAEIGHRLPASAAGRRSRFRSRGRWRR